MLDSPVVTGCTRVFGYQQVVSTMTNPRVCWMALRATGALGLIAVGAVAAMPWVFVPAVILLAYSAGPLLSWWRVEHRVRAEAALGIARIETWLRTAPALPTASVGAAFECCPICGVPVDPRNARCRRHGATR